MMFDGIDLSGYSEDELNRIGGEIESQYVEVK